MCRPLLTHYIATYQYVPAPCDVSSMPSELVFSSIIFDKPKSVIRTSLQIKQVQIRFMTSNVASRATIIIVQYRKVITDLKISGGEKPLRSLSPPPSPLWNIHVIVRGGASDRQAKEVT